MAPISSAMTQKEHLAEQRSELVKAAARKLGFSYCGISQAQFLEEEAPRLEQWLKAGRHGSMHYMERNFDKRLDPRLLVEGTKSVISVLYNYYPEREQRDEVPKISRYAYGEDYHEVIRGKLRELLEDLQAEIGEIHGRAFVDSAPVMDKVWAKKSGLGWMGKNTNLIRKQSGSWFFIGELLVDVELAPDGPVPDYCGSCTKCIDACPTDALSPYQLDANKCISYLTIELREAIPADFQDKMKNWMFGCDICQEVCPWNRFSRPHQEPAFNPNSVILEYNLNDWQTMTEETFNQVFKRSPLKRSGYQGVMRNLRFISGEKK